MYSPSTRLISPSSWASYGSVTSTVRIRWDIGRELGEAPGRESGGAGGGDGGGEGSDGRNVRGGRGTSHSTSGGGRIASCRERGASGGGRGRGADGGGRSASGGGRGSSMRGFPAIVTCCD